MRPQFASPARLGAPILILAIPRTAPSEHDLVPAAPAPPAPRPAGRIFFPEPGKQTVVRWGDFKPMLSPQLAHPDRLRDSHRLPCLLQVYEALAPQAAAPLAAAHFEALTEQNEVQLGLAGLLPPRMASPVPPGVQPDSVLPYERFFRLRVASDPTRDLAPGRSEPASLRRAIPEKYLNAWEFRSSREEVLYDMNQPRGVWLRLGAAIRRWFTRSAAQREFRIWQALLTGKPAEDQLFAVRPPRGALERKDIRDWAVRTLALAGYDPGSMLTEWEIYWRRKGL